MKRYRVVNIDFDTRANILNTEIKSEWEESTKECWEKNKEQITAGLRKMYGDFNFDNKIQKFVDLGDKPISILAFHNRFFEQVRIAFVMGSYYPALVGCCALGERILNHLILLLRDDYKLTPEYKSVYRKDSFDNWNIVIETLHAWDVLLPEAVDRFRDLMEKRQKAIHFRPEIDTNDRQLALEAIHCLREIIEIQFSGFGTQPWFITEIPGEIYIKKSWESVPFVAKIYIPNCVLVGPKHKFETVIPEAVIRDEHEYEEREITDDEFVLLRKGYLVR